MRNDLDTNLEATYASFLKELEIFKKKNKERSDESIGMWDFPLNMFWIIVFGLGFYLLGTGKIAGSMPMLILGSFIYWYVRRGTIIQEAKDWAKENSIDKIVELFCKDKSWDLEYPGYLEDIPPDVSVEDYEYMIEAVTGIDMDDIIMEDWIIGRKGDNIFYHFDFGYMFDSRYIYGGEGFMLNLKKPIDGYLYVVSDTLEKAGGFVGKGAQKAISSAIPNSNDLISMDNPEFEKYFAVRGEDKVLAHYILTPTFMENLTKLAKLHDVTTFISFHKHWMFIALDTPHDKFELNIQNNDVLDEIMKIDKELLNILEIVETINLDMHEINIHAK